MQKEKIVSISGLRGFSCLIIMLYHYRFFLLDNGIGFINYGHYFVEVFVTISGFLIAYNYRNRIAGMNFINFFMKRYLKIMPLYWITEICVYGAVILATVLSGEEYRWNPMQMLLEFSGFYTGWFGQTEPPMNNPLWTVCCILLCYVLYYLLCKISKNRSFYYISLLLLVILASVVSLILMIYKEVPYFVIGNEDLLRCIISFMIGLILFELYENMPDQMGKLLTYVLLGVFLGIIIAFSKLQIIDGTNNENVIWLIVIFLFCPLMLYSVIYINTIKRIFTGRILQFIGTISMDIYMWHWVVRIYLGSRPFYVDQNTLSGWILLIVISILMAIVSHYFLLPLIYNMEKNIRKKIVR